MRNKTEWIKWARKIGVCTKCAARGHREPDCKVGDTKSGEKEKEKEKLSALGQDRDNIAIDSGIDHDSEYLCSIHDRKDVLLIYHCTINRV